MSPGSPSNYFVHTLLRARDWQRRPQLDDVCHWWRRSGRGVCAWIGMGGAGKTAVAERFLRRLPGGLPVDPQVDNAHPTIGHLIADAKQLLHEALNLWHDLRDPEPTEDNNFVHPETGIEYNYKAAETHQVLTDLEAVMLTRHFAGQAASDDDEVFRETEDDGIGNRCPIQVSFAGIRLVARTERATWRNLGADQET